MHYQFYNNVVTIATRLLAERSGVRIAVGAKIFLFSKTSRPTLEPTHPPIQWAPGCFPEDKAAVA
jgi:hypothetical protein